MTNVMELRRETEAARELLKSIAETLGDDQELIETTIEGETGLMEALERAVNRVMAIDGLLTGIKAQKDNLTKRQERLEAQKDILRTTICAAMEIAGKRRLELAVCTVTAKAVPPKLIINDEADIPSDFWKPSDPKLDKAALLAALKDKKQIPGATLSNGSSTIAIRTV
jgi:hypothetical protein